MKDIRSIITEARLGGGVIALHQKLVSDLKKAGYDDWGASHYEEGSYHRFGTYAERYETVQHKRPETLHRILEKHGFVELPDYYFHDEFGGRVNKMFKNPITGAHIHLEYDVKPIAPAGIPKQYRKKRPDRTGPHIFEIAYPPNVTAPNW